MTSLLLNTNTPHTMSSLHILCSLCCSLPLFLTPVFALPSLLSFTPFTSFSSFIQLSSIYPSHLHSSYLVLLHISLSPSPILKHCPSIFLLSHPYSPFLSNVFFHFPSLPINIFPSFHLPSPLLRSTPSLPLPTYRTIRRSTWSTYTAGLTACAPRTKAPTSSSPPLPSI